MRLGLILAAIIIGNAFNAAAGDRPIRFECQGLESYEIRGTRDVDWAWGDIRSLDGHVVIGFSIGLMVQPLRCCLPSSILLRVAVRAGEPQER